MSECVFRDGTVISDYGRPYIVSEVNSSHNGSMEVAKRMIDASVASGCDCVKFQSWSVSSLYSKTYYDENPISRRFVQKFSMSPEQLKELAVYCRNKKIAFSSTPYSEQEVDFLVDECNVPYIKIASMEINNLSFLRYIGGKKMPVVLSTGMSDIDEVQCAVDILHTAGVTEMVILHCVSVYPVELQNVNLNNIIGLRNKFQMHPIGFSDHTEGDSAAIAAVAIGASLIEKHLTLDKSRIGMDNGMATEPEELKVIVDKCRSIQIAMGKTDRVVSKLEKEQRLKMRRSIIAVRDIKSGEIINISDLYAKRPGTGIAPNRIEEVVGKRAVVDIMADTIILPDELE